MNSNHSFISEFTSKTIVSGLYIIDDIRSGSTRAGKPYLSATLIDRSGRINMVAWEYEGLLTADNNGQIVALTGMVGSYRDAPQLRVEQIELASLDDYDREDLLDLIPTASINVTEYIDDLNQAVERIMDEDLYNICCHILNKHWDRFVTIPAGKSVHHNYCHGLLMHVVDMLALAETLAERHPASLNYDLLISGVILHDIGKLSEFVTSPVTGLVIGYSSPGELLGHPSLGAIEVEEAAKAVGARAAIKVILQHLILSHHGDPQCGAARVPVSVEAEMLHCLDMLDSRRAIYESSTMNIPAGAFSPLIGALGKRICRFGYGVDYA